MSLFTDLIERVYLGKIERFSLTNPYFVPDERIIKALIEARRPGVRIGLLLPGEIDHEVVEDASSAGFGRLLDAGVEIYQYQAGLLHSKAMPAASGKASGSSSPCRSGRNSRAWGPW